MPTESSTATEGVPFQPVVIPAGRVAAGAEVVPGPDSDQQITNTVSVDLGDGVIQQPFARITVPACSGPEAPTDVTFTFTVTPSVATAAVGDTIEYAYCGQNTSDVELEIVRLVDDRLGVVIELPSVETVVAPGDSLCNTDLDLPSSTW